MRSSAARKHSTNPQPPEPPRPKLARLRFVRAPGAPIGDDDAVLIGNELLKIAEANKVGDLRLLDKKLVFAQIEADAKHPLRKFYNWDVQQAARRHWIEQTGTLIRSIRVVEVAARLPGKPQPMFVFAEVTGKDSTETRRTHVLRSDLLNNDPAFASAIGYQIRHIRDALMQLEGLTSSRCPDNVARLRDALRESLDDYQATLTSQS